MKRFLILLAYAAMFFVPATVQAQGYQMVLTRADGTAVDSLTSTIIYFVDDAHIAVYRYRNDAASGQFVVYFDTLDVRDLGTADFLCSDGRLWSMDYAPSVLGSNPTDYGYASVMHVRDLLTEDMTTWSTGYNWYAQALEINLNPAYTMAHLPWRYYTRSIQQCSYFIQAVAGNGALDRASQEQLALLAEARIIRALLNLDFARMYEFLPNEAAEGITSRGNNVTNLTVPILDGTQQLYGSGASSIYYAPRATKAEMVSFIQQDLEQAEALMPNVSSSTSHEVPHLDVVYGLRARLALWAEDYAAASTYAAKALAASSTTIMTDAQILSTTKGFNDIECWMWGVQQDYEHGRNLGDEMANYVSWMSPEWQEGYASVVPPMIGRSLYDRIPDTDSRKRLFVAPAGSALSGKTPLIDSSVDMAEYTAVKFRPAGGEVSDIAACSTGYPLMRVEEMYYILAEAAAQTGDLEQARQYLEAVVKPHNPTYACTLTEADALIQEIILQKRIEFWGEGQTFFDVKRLNMSVTRDYDDTNFYALAARNTTGRPYWMNLVFPSTAASANLALYGMENPQSNDYVQPSVDPDFVLDEPAFKKDLAVLPLDSVYMIRFHGTLPERLQEQYEDITLELSTKADFPQDRTVAFSTMQREQGTLAFEGAFNTYGFMNYTTALLALDGIAEAAPAVIYLRALTGDALSNTIEIPVTYASSSIWFGFSYMPKVHVRPVGTIDCEAVAGEDFVQVLNLELEGEGSFYVRSNYNEFETIGWLYYGGGRSNFSVNADGMADNRREDFNWNAEGARQYICGPSFESYTFGDGRFESYVTRNDLVMVTSTRSDSIAVSLKFNAQAAAEAAHTWTSVGQLPLTSEYKSELTGSKFTLQRAEDEEGLYRVLAPYQRGHNLMFRVADDGTLTLSSQAACYVNGQRISVSGTGQKQDDLYTFTLLFISADGQTQICTEVLGVCETSLGTGTYTYSVLGGETKDHELYKSEYAEEYRIPDWCYGVNFRFTVNEDGTIDVPTQPIGYTHPTYGEIQVASVSHYNTSWEDNSHYDAETGTYTFTLVYYVNAGNFGHGDETFVLTPASEPRRISGRAEQKVQLGELSLMPDRRLRTDNRIGEEPAALPTPSPALLTPNNNPALLTPTTNQ